MPSNLEDSNVVLIGPRPREPLPLAPYNVPLASGAVARMQPIHDPKSVSQSLIAFLANAMNDEV
jgi:hypothetical protein